MRFSKGSTLNLKLFALDDAEACVLDQALALSLSMQASANASTDAPVCC
jgi:hypothetical protein